MQVSLGENPSFKHYALDYQTMASRIMEYFLITTSATVSRLTSSSILSLGACVLLMEDHCIDSVHMPGHGDRVFGDQDMAALGLEFLLLCDI